MAAFIGAPFGGSFWLFMGAPFGLLLGLLLGLPLGLPPGFSLSLCASWVLPSVLAAVPGGAAVCPGCARSRGVGLAPCWGVGLGGVAVRVCGRGAGAGVAGVGRCLVLPPLRSVCGAALALGRARVAFGWGVSGFPCLVRAAPARLSVARLRASPVGACSNNPGAWGAGVAVRVWGLPFGGGAVRAGVEPARPARLTPPVRVLGHLSGRLPWSVALVGCLGRVAAVGCIGGCIGGCRLLLFVW